MNKPLENQATAKTQASPKSNISALRAFQLRHGRTWMSVWLAISDIAAFVLSATMAFWFYNLLIGGAALQDYTRLIALSGVFTVIYTIRQLYPATEIGPVEELRLLTLNTSIVFLAMTTFAFLGKTGTSYSRFLFFVTWLFSLGFIPVGRYFVRTLFSRLQLWGTPIIIFGSHDYAQQIEQTLQQWPQIGLTPTIVCDHGTCPAILGKAALSLPNCGYEEKCSYCQGMVARMALVVYDDYNEIDSVREKYTDTFERVILVNHRDYGIGLSSVSVREVGGLTGLEIHYNLLDRWTQAEKRLIDLLISTMGLLLLMPFFLLISTLISIDSPGRVLYRQQRIGKGGRRFGMLKFRTMHQNADEEFQAILNRDLSLKAEWEQYQKLQNDPRITWVGNLLRRFSIDELPQLLNVFTGEMSLVGPRPIMVSQETLYGESYKHYKRVNPGITGLWQVSGRNKTTFTRRADLDVLYVMNWSIWLDIHILARTAWVVLVQDGAT